LDTEQSIDTPSQGQASRKGYWHGTHRAVAPETTWQRIRPHFSRLGITRVAVITRLDVVGIPVVMVSRPNSRSLSVSQGKGIDLCHARVSGAMESIEQHCAEHLDLPLRYGAWREIRARHWALDPAELPCFERESVQSRATLWVEGRRCLDGEPCWVPHALVHLDLRRPLAPGSELFPLSSNGLASGNTVSEATVHALLELIERDAWSRFGDLPPDAREERRLALGSVTDAHSNELLQKFRCAGLNVAVWDLTSELGVACFLCQLVEEESDWAFQIGRAEGLGCHTDRGIALGRALCEAAQSRLCAISGSRDDMTQASVARIRDPGAVRRAQHDLGRASSSGRDFAAVRTHHFPSFDQELAWLVQALDSWVGAQVIAIDIPPHGVPVSVVRVVASGLRPPHFLPSERPRVSARGEGSA
jgi:ribosomal protein S12 methylthiotransferase accessory factor